MAKRKNYDDFDNLVNDLKSDIEDTLSKEVFNTVRDIELWYIKRDVMDRYQPQIYERRSSGGIDDPSNIKGKVRDMELMVRNETPFNTGYGTGNRGNGLAVLINEGTGGKSDLYYDYVGEFECPTHFLENTQWDIDHTKDAENALNEGLKRRGYEIK